ncbi:MAG: XRE family transcriptional regulator, partial [Planctomycetota bacterium]
AEVRAMTGIGVSSLSEYERGRREPALHQLRALGDAYGRPLSFFLSEPGTGAEAVLWRERPDSDSAATLGRRFLELVRQYHRVESWCGEESRPDLPVAGSAPRNYRDAEALADRVRERLGLGDRPGTSLIRVLSEVANAKIFHLDHGESGAAACTVHREHGAGILLNARHLPWRRNFDAAHELFHLVTWQAFGHDAEGGDLESGRREEKYATYFARNLLMPRGPYRAAISRDREKETSPERTVLRIAREFEVSMEDVVWMRATEKRWPKSRALTLIERCRLLEGTMLPRDREVDPPSRPTRFVSLVYQALDEGEISLGRAAEFLGVSRAVVRRTSKGSWPHRRER